MDWDVSVNGPAVADPPEQEFVAPKDAKHTQVSFGNCLYFGPAGQRCSDRATATGFCPRHRPNTPSVDGTYAILPTTPILTPKRIGVIFTILALLWPVIADVVRELIRFFR